MRRNGNSCIFSGKRMRKGTHSCIACRRRKIRCVFPSDQSKVCVDCSKRGAVCTPQGLQSEYPIRPFTTEDHHFSDGELTLTEALGNLRKRVERALQDVLPNSEQTSSPVRQHSISHTTSGGASSSESVQTDCAPIIKLFGNGMIGHVVRAESSTVDFEYSSRESESTTHPNSSLPPRHAQAVHALCTALPPESELKEILRKRSDWWVAWRESFGLVWGDAKDNDFEAFAIRTFCSGHPSLLGSLLVCLALSVGTYEQYLLPVEHWILYDDELAGCEYGLQCLMGLGLCFFSALQPRRAWTVYRRANSLLQMNGIHRSHRKSERLDLIFWQLFHADRWLSLMIGLPYSVPDELCDLYIPTADTIPLVTFHYRHLAVLTGRVIDCLQALHGPSLSTIAKIDEQIDAVASRLPSDYLDLAQVCACENANEKYARIFRITQVHQLKAYLHLPLFLQRSDESIREYGRRACVNSSRTFLEAYLEIYDDNHSRAVMDNSIKLTGFSAFAAAVTLFLHLLDCGQAQTAESARVLVDVRKDMSLISRTMEALKNCSGGRTNSLCGQCYTALDDLVSTCRDVESGTVRKFTLPYFGMVSIGPRPNDPGHRDDRSWINHSANENLCGDTSLAATRETHGNIFDLSTPLDNIFWDYQGPLMFYDNLQTSVSAGSQHNSDLAGLDYRNLPILFQ
ncbi:hypothetical protein V1509DRAFT_633098 [Lipomyces kononenkoae]